MKRFTKRAIALLFAMTMMLSCVATGYACEVDEATTPAAPAVAVCDSVADADAVAPASVQTTTTYADVFMEMYSGYTNTVRVTPPRGAKLMVYLSWHSGSKTILQLKKPGESGFTGVHDISQTDGNYTHNITLIPSCSGGTYEIRFYTLGVSTISYLIEAEY